MVLLSKTAMVRWNGFTKKHYVSKGYTWTTCNDYFECKIEDIMETSTAKVDVKCDYCNEKTKKEYRKYIKGRLVVEKDACGNPKCRQRKNEEMNIKQYGVKNSMQLEHQKEKMRKIFQTSTETVENICKDKGLRVLNLEDYQNNKTRLFVVCKNHSDKGVQETNFGNIKSGKNCCLYGGSEKTGESKRKDGEIVFEDFIKKGLIPKFSPNDYNKNSQPLPFLCPDHEEIGIQYRSYGGLDASEGCIKCSRERTKTALRSDEKEVFEYFKSRGLIPVEKEKYINRDHAIKFKCIKHLDVIQDTSLSSLKGTSVPCSVCRAENSITVLNKRIRSSLGLWRKRSEIECNYRCVLTDSKSYDIHHTYSYNSIIEDVLKKLKIKIKDNYEGNEYLLIKNEVIKTHEDYIGVCIHPLLHIEFHRLYGKQNNILGQFEEFKQRYLNGEFKNILIDEKDIS